MLLVDPFSFDWILPVERTIFNKTSVSEHLYSCFEFIFGTIRVNLTLKSESSIQYFLL